MIQTNILLAIVLAPLVGSIVAGLFGRRVGRAGAHTVTILGVAIAAALSMHVLWQFVAHDADPTRTSTAGSRSAATRPTSASWSTSSPP